MKNYSLAACLLLAVSVSSCTTDEYIYISPTLRLGRVASKETEYTNDSACTAAATEYNGRNKPIQVSDNPLVYSFRKKPFLFGEKFEVRFATVPSAQADGKKIDYLEIDKKSETDNAANLQVILVAIQELKKKGATILRDTVLDKPINGKRAWRVVMHTDKEIPDKDNTLTNLKGDFGIIVNPPYPP
jgi:hypothetical protein